MTFSYSVKKELFNKFPKSYKDAVSEFIGIFRVIGSIISDNNGDISIKILVENEKFIEYIEKLFLEFFNKKFDLYIKKFKKFPKSKIYILKIIGVDVCKFLENLGILKFVDNYISINLKFDDGNISEKSFLKGVFLSSGNISNPEKGYHLEFIIYSMNFCQYLKEFLDSYDLKAKIIKRKFWYLVYIKESDNISKILNIIGAHQSLLDFENVRVKKEYSNNKNRVRNCIEANEDKLIITSVRQVKAIMLIERKMGLDKLPKNLRDIAQIRLKYKESSLKELGEFLNPPIGKSGVSHRLKKIEQIAKQLLN